MNSRTSLLIRRRNAILLFFATVFTLFGSLFATVQAQSLTPDNVTLSLTATTPSGIPNVAFLGDRITYTLRITNTGNSTLNNVLLIDDLPRDTLDDYECSDNCDYQTESQSFPDPLGGTITVTVTRRISWTIATLAPGQVVNQSFSAKVVGQPDGAEFTNRAFAYYLINGIPTTVNSNDNIVASRVRLPQDGKLAVSSAATWFSDDFGGTLSQDWGDFDRDGDLDLLLGSSIATTIYRNDNGDLNRYWSTERTAYGVRWMDVGAPNFSFVAVGASVDGTAVTTGTNVIYTFNPNATNAATRFLEVDTFLSDLQLIRVQPGDVNRDGWVDLVATTNAINAECPTQLFLHSKDPVAPYADYRTACASNDASAAIALGDADNDGDVDLASGRFASQDATLLFNNIVSLNATTVLTDVIFTDTNSVSIETGLSFLPYDFSWGDYNNDGLLDLAAAYPLEREARVYRNLGGEFADPIVIRTGIFRTPLAVDWGDFDNDGVLELAVADSIPRIYKISPTGVVSQLAALATNAIPIGTQIWSIRGIDQDNDNDLDLALASRDGPSQVFTFFAPFLDSAMTIVDSTPSSSVAWGDADGDGTQDLLLGAGPPSTNGFGTRLYYNQGGRFQPNQSDQITGFGPHAVAFGDVTKDGRLDIALGTTAQTQIYLADELTSPAWVSPNANSNNALAWGDYDHDGDLDLLVGSSQASLIYRKQGNLLQNEPIWISEVAGDDTRAVAWADFDGDKLLDFVIGNNGQPNRLYRNIQRDEFEEVEWNPAVGVTRALAWGDYDRDGDLDLAVAHYNGSVLIYANLTIDNTAPEATLSDTPFVLPASNHRPTALAWGDWDNDGDLDLAVGHDGFNLQVYANQTRNAETPNFAWVWASDDATYNATGVAWGDFDNDGDLDLAASQSGSDANGLFINGYITPSHLRNFETTIPLPDNSSYIQVERPGQTDEAFFHSAPEILSGPVQPSVAIRYRVYDPDGSRDATIPNPAGDGIVRTLFDYSLDGGGTWETATPTSETVPITMTSRLGVEGLFIWDAQADQAISDQTLFRVRVIPVASTGSRPRGAAVGISAPFRVRGTTCEWPENATMTISPTHPLPGELVRFTGAITAGTGVISYTWDFGDGSTAQGQNVSHTYTRRDQFNVLLTVSGPPCPINYPAYTQTTLTVGDPVIGPDTFLPLIGRNNDNGEAEPRPDNRAWPEETTKLPPSHFQPTRPTVVPSTAVMALQNLCLAPDQVSDSPIGISNQPVINTDGSRIAFWSTGDIAPITDTNNTDGNIEIFLWRRDTPGTPFYQVTDSPGTILGGLNIAPSINAAGDRIAFFSDRNLSDDNADGTFEIFVASIATTGEITLTQVTDAERTSSILPSISANGRRVAYISDELGSPDVYVADLNADGTVNTRTRVTNLPGSTTDQPIISANGQVIAFISNANLSNGNPDGNGEIFVARNTGGTNWSIQQITFTGATAFNSDADLNSNGTALAFISTGEFNPTTPDNPEGNAELFLATLGNPNTITQITRSTNVTNERPTMSDDSSRIAFISNANAGGGATEQTRVFLYDAILNSYGEVSNQTNSNSGEPMLNAAGDRITYVANNSGDREVYRLDCFVADISISSTVSPDPLVPGAPLTYTYSINNAGPNDSITTTVAITVPPEVLSITASPPGCTINQSTGEVTCNLATVPANQSRLVRVRGVLDGEARDILTAIGTVESETFDRNLANDSTALETSVQPELSLVLTVTDVPDPVVAGTPLTYTLRVVNQGPSTATDIEVRDTFPPAFLNPTLVPTAGCTLIGSQLSCDYASLLPNGQQNITVTGVLDSFARNTLTNSATVQSNEYPLDTSTESTTILANVALTTSAVVAPVPLQAGEAVTFTVTLTNSGPSGATGVVARTTIPTDVTGIAITPSGICAPPSGNTITCNFATINPNSTRSYTIAGTLDPSARGNRLLTNQVSSIEAPLPTATTQPLTIVATVDLDIDLNSSPTPPIAGGQLTYTFNLDNNGPATATAIVVTDTFSPLYNILSFSSGCRHTPGTPVVCEIPSLAPASSQAFTVTGSLNANSSGTITNTVLATALEAPIPVTDELVETINASATFSVTPGVLPTTVVAGERVTYTLVITNLGPSNATGVEVNGTVENLVLTSITIVGGCTRSGTDYTCNFGTMPPNTTRTITASGVVSSTYRGILENSAILTATQLSAPETYDFSREVDVDVDLSFELLPDPDGDVFAGTPITYTLRARNEGNSTALDVVITDTFDHLLTTTASTGCVLAGRTYTCNLPTGIQPNSTVNFTVTGSISPTADLLTNNAQLTWNETGDILTDSRSQNVFDSVQFTITNSTLPSPDVIAGEPLTYSIGVINNGVSDAPSVVITGTVANILNPTATVTVGSGNCTINSGIYSCDVGNLSANGGSGSIRVNGVVSPTLRATLKNAFTISAQSNPPVSVSRNLSNSVVEDINLLNITPTVSPTTPIAGRKVEYTFTIVNPNDSTALDVQLVDTLSRIITSTYSFQTTQGSCTDNDFVVTCAIGSIPRNGQVVIRISADVNPVQPPGATSINNGYVLSSTDLDNNITGNVNRTMTVNADLNLTVTAQDTITAGAPYSYTVSLTNNGAATAVTTTLTGTLSFIVNPIENSPLCTILSGELSCTIGTLTEGQNFSVRIDGTVDPARRTPITNTFFADSTQSAPKTTPKTTTVTADSDLAIAITSIPEDAVVAGQTVISYTVTVTNTGQSSALDTLVTATVASLITSTLDISPDSDCELTLANVIVCDVGTLPRNNPFELTYAGLVSPSARDVITTTAQTIDRDTPTAQSATITADVDTNTALSINVTNSTPVTAGLPIVYTLRLTDTGSSSATDVVITGTLNGLLSPIASNPLCEISGTDLTCTIDELLPSDPFITTIEGDTSPTRRTNITNSFRAVSNEASSLLAQNTAIVTSDIDFGLNIAATGVVTPGAQLRYTLSLSNTGDSTAVGAILTDTYANFVTTPTVSVLGAAGTCTPNHANQRVVCTFANLLTTNTTATVTIQGQLAGTLPLTVTNTATISEFTPANTVTKTLNLPRGSSHPLQVNITASGTVTNSAPFTYTIHVANSGNLTAQGVVITDTFAQYATTPTVTVAGASAVCTRNFAQRRVRCNYGNNLTANMTSTITIVGNLTATLPTTFTNSILLRSTNPSLTLQRSILLTRNTTYPVPPLQGRANQWWLPLPFIALLPHKKRR
jgi:uncharacterized repeat protein (TIGR01451 family)